MYATFRYYRGATELADTLVENESDIKELIGGIEGFRAYYLVRTSTGDTVSLSVFDDEEGAEASNKAAAAWVAENAADVAATPQVSAGDVAISF